VKKKRRNFTKKGGRKKHQKVKSSLVVSPDGPVTPKYCGGKEQTKKDRSGIRGGKR